MKVVKERSRLIFTDYTEDEKHQIEKIVSTMDNIFIYTNDDKNIIYLPTGLEKIIKTQFKIDIEDRSNTHWDYEVISKPENNPFTPRDQMQKDIIDFTIKNAKDGNNIAIIAFPGSGKEQPHSTKIPTPTPQGWTMMGNLNIGDYVFDRSGKPTKVIGVFDQGEKDVYKITFSDGRHALCGLDHLWMVCRNDNIYHVKSTRDILDEYSNNCNYVYQIPMGGQVEYEYVELPIDPYLIGVFTSCGNLLNDQLNLIYHNDDIANTIVDKYNWHYKKNNDNGTSYIFFDSNNNPIYTRDFFKAIPEMINSTDHYIPDKYIYNDINNRMELMRGLMDGGGNILRAGGTYHTTFSSHSLMLIHQVQQILYSLGLSGTIITRINTGSDNIKNILMLNIPNAVKKDFFTIGLEAQNASNAYSQYDDNINLYITDIELIGRDQSRCIMVDNSEHLYLTENYIVTHNTSMTIACLIEVGMRSLIIVPTTNVRRQWKDSLIKMFGISPDNITEVDSPDKFVNINTDFCIILQASLSSISKKYDLEKLMRDNKFGVKVIDEAHMYFNNTIRIDGSSNIKNNWYLTATFGRSAEEENVLYHQMFSNIEIFRVKDKEASIFNRKPGTIYGHKPHTNCFMYWAPSELSSEEIKSVSTSKRYNEKENRWMRYGISVPKYTSLVIPPDKKTIFIEKILKIVKIASKIPYGRMLILSPTIESVETLSKYIQQMFPKYYVGTIHSHNDKDTNTSVMDKADIIISTVKSSGTGFDVKNLSTLIVIEPFKSLILTEQVMGRLRRRPDGKDTYMYDVVDASVQQLKSWANNRSQFLKMKSKKFTVIDI